MSIYDPDYKAPTWTVTPIGLADSDTFDKSDAVNSPPHYTQHPSGIECIEVSQHYNFCIGNAIKYLWRNGLKKSHDLTDKDSQIQDLRKAIWYIEREIDNLEQNVYE